MWQLYIYIPSILPEFAWETFLAKCYIIPLLACHQNLGHLIRMPYGCGEQNMIKFAPNVFILQYLTITRQATPEVTSRLTNLMKTGVATGTVL